MTIEKEIPHSYNENSSVCVNCKFIKIKDNMVELFFYCQYYKDFNEIKLEENENIRVDSYGTCDFYIPRENLLEE